MVSPLIYCYKNVTDLTISHPILSRGKTTNNLQSTLFGTKQKIHDIYQSSHHVGTTVRSCNAEATLNTPMKISNSKKRKNEQSQFSKVKKVMMMTQQNSEGARELSQPCTDISTPCSVIGNKPLRKNYHLGGKKYAIFHRERDVIDHIQIKEWDGKVVIKEGVKLNRSRFVMILHNVENIKHTLKKILKEEDGLNSRIYMGASYYLSVNSSYKTVAIRM